MNPEVMSLLFPTLRVRNIRNYPVNIRYDNGDTVQLQPNSTTSITSNGLSQVPDQTSIKLVAPTMSDLMSAGAFEANA
jgi:hypothetical protein